MPRRSRGCGNLGIVFSCELDPRLRGDDLIVESVFRCEEKLS